MPHDARRIIRRIAIGLGVSLGLAAAGFALWLGLRDAWWLEAAPYGDIEVATDVIDRAVGLGAGFEATIVATDDGPQLRIRHGQQLLWSSVPGRAFIAAARGVAELHEARGMASVDDDITGRCVDQKVDLFRALTPDQPAFMEGTLDCGGTPWPYRLVLAARGDRRLTFDIALAVGDDRAPNRVVLVKQSRADEGFFGFGEQFTHFDLKGRDVPVVVSEQGIGRGVQPLTLGADLTADGAGGSWATTYVAAPWYLTSTMQGFALEEDAISRFDLRRDDAAVVSLLAPRMRGSIYRGASPLELIEAYTATVGRMKALPEWIHRGAVIGMQGGTEKVRSVRAKLKAADVPLAGFWLQDWVGQRTTSFGKQLWWSWTLDGNHYPGWTDLVAELAADDVRVMTYVNPFLVDAAERGDGARNLFAEARDAGYLVQRGDGSPYLIRNTSFSAGLLDLTHPDARGWFLDILQDEVLGAGASGWMADFGEGLPFDARLHDRSVDAAAYHNAYPVEWAALNREAIRRAGREGDVVFFTRAGYRTSPGHSTLFWLGDQLVSWDRHDGLHSALIGLLSGGLSGFSLNHSDIGGYTTITHSIEDHHRSVELHQRWAEMAAFTVVFRTHEGNRPDANAQFHHPEVLPHFAAMARLHRCWMPYRSALMAEAEARGWPINRHMWVAYPGLAGARALDRQFMVGADLLVAPVLRPGVDTVEVVVPDDGWVHIWSGDRFDAGRHTVAAPIGEPAAFARHGSAVAASLRGCLAP